MSPRKKQKTTLRDFTNVLSSIANLYDEKGDAGRSRSFTNASTNLCAFADVTNKELDAPLKSSEDFKDVKGVEKSTLEMLDEFIETGKCTRLEELEEKPFKLVDKKSETTKKAEKEKLECSVGIFRERGVSDDKGDYMFAYVKKGTNMWTFHEDTRMLTRGPSTRTCLYKDIGEYYLATCEDCTRDEYGYRNKSADELLDSWSTPYAGLMYWDTYIPKGKFEFVREATADDMKRKDWKGDGPESQSFILPMPSAFSETNISVSNHGHRLVKSGTSSSTS